MLRKAICLGLIGCTAGIFSLTAVAGQGNDAPSGAHYNLNLLCKEMPKGKSREGDTVSGEITQGNGHRIFVPCDGSVRIYLAEGDFQVIDYDGTDGVAEFMLPAADANCDGVTDYGVFVRALGPGGSATIKYCIEDKAGGPDLVDEYCNLAQSLEIRDSNGKKIQFTNVTKELLTVTTDIDGDGQTESRALFDDEYFMEYWDYTNDNLKVAQMRFYPEEGVNYDDGQESRWCLQLQN